MDVEKLITTWGIPLPFLIVLVKMLYDLLYKIVPDRFDQMKLTLVQQAEDQKNRHSEHMEALYELVESMKPNRPIGRAAAKKRTRRRGVRQSGHDPVK